jgi:DNA-binding transcriptional ArsR family regulator
MTITKGYLMLQTASIPVSDAEIPPLRAKFFRGLADPSRLAIMETLRTAPQTVGKIVNATQLTQSNVSNHLACLLECGLVLRERQGRFMVYALADPRIERLLALTDEVMADVAANIRNCSRYGTIDGRS